MNTTTPPHVCPAHAVALAGTPTRYGVRWGCPVEGCTVVCWAGGTSTPADAETRVLRHRCHELFDPRWRDRTHFRSRRGAYKWLADVMGVPAEKAHIGMFDRAQCERLLRLLGEG
jgi:hypothetical protein